MVSAAASGRARRVAGIAGLRIGVIANLGVDLHPDTARVLDHTRKRLETLGATISEVSLSESLRDLAAPCGDLLAIDAYCFYGHFAEADPTLGAPCAGAFSPGATSPRIG